MRELTAIHIVIVVYGRKYSELLASITLANLAAMVREIPDDIRLASKVRIFTTEGDIDIIAASPALDRLRESMLVELVARATVGGFEQHGDYGPMVLTQQLAVVEASQEGAALFFVGPDQIYNRGAFAFFIDRLRKGYRIIVGPGPRILRDAVRSTIMKEIGYSADGTFAFSPRDQAKVFFTFWHPINDLFLLESEKGIYWKAYAYFRPHPTELLLRFFQGPTFVAWPKAPIPTFEGYIDHEISRVSCFSWRDAYVIQDSSECLALDMTADDRMDGMPPADFPRVDLLKQLFKPKDVNDLQLKYAFRTCRVHVDDGEHPELAKWKRELDRFIDPIIVMAMTQRVITRRLGRWAGRLIGFLFITATETVAFFLMPVVRGLASRWKVPDPIESCD